MNKLTHKISELVTRTHAQCAWCSADVEPGAHIILTTLREQPRHYENPWLNDAIVTSIEDAIRQAGTGRHPLLLPYGVFVACKKCEKNMMTKCVECGVLYPRSIQIRLRAAERSGRQEDPKMCPACVNDLLLSSCFSCKKSLENGGGGIEYIDGHGVQKMVCEKCHEKLIADGVAKVCVLCGKTVSIEHVHDKIHTLQYTPKMRAMYFSGEPICVWCREDIYSSKTIHQCAVCSRIVSKGGTKRIVQTRHAAEIQQSLSTGVGRFPPDILKQYICLSCESRAKTTCATCGTPMLSLKNSCGNCHAGGLQVRNYQHRPTPIFVGTPPHFGLEIETTGFVDEAMRAKVSAAIFNGIGAHEKAIYQKRDSSIGLLGIEFCFHPRSVDRWFDDSGVALLSGFRDTIRKYGGHSYQSGLCGVHIHRSAHDILFRKTTKDKSSLNVIRWLASMLALEPYLLVFGQRSGINASISREGDEEGTFTVNDYGNFGYVKKALGEHGVSSKDTVEWYRCVRENLGLIDRHGAVNIATGLNTVEYRFFRGTLRVDTLLSYVALAYYIAEWSKSVSLSHIRSLEQQDALGEFVNFVGADTAHQDASSHLLKYIRDRRIA